MGTSSDTVKLRKGSLAALCSMFISPGDAQGERLLLPPVVWLLVEGIGEGEAVLELSGVRELSEISAAARVRVSVIRTRLL